MELESKLEEANSASGSGNSVPRVPGSREELELKLAEASKKVRQFQYVLNVYRVGRPLVP